MHRAINDLGLSRGCSEVLASQRVDASPVAGGCSSAALRQRSGCRPHQETSITDCGQLKPSLRFWPLQVGEASLSGLNVTTRYHHLTSYNKY